MSNNYSALAFWRAWHRSFNRWTIRYIYIPLGGNKKPIVNTLVVFTFVAFWHDISLKLLVWGWLIVLFILPEVLARMVMPPKRVRLVTGKYRLIVLIVEFVAWISACLCNCCRWEYSHDDDCQSHWILCGIGWYRGSIKGYARELLRYDPGDFHVNS
jgi:D-alanyl-lipoteichoic acid acyltransferase DltB (MBOAT superfamily)